MTKELVPEIVVDEKEKLIRFRGKYVSKVPKTYEILKATAPEQRKQKMVEIIGFEALNDVEEYTKHYKIRKGDTVVDAGAHVGVLTQEFSKLVGKDGLVIAVEPDYRALGMLTHNVADLNNVKIIPYALWYKEDVLPFHYMDANSGIGTGSLIYQFPYWHPTRAMTLDKLLSKYNVKEVNFIKMDIEGSEIRALEGAQETLKTVDALAIASYHPINNKGKKSYKDVLSILEAKAFVTRLETGKDGEIVYANRM